MAERAVPVSSGLLAGLKLTSEKWNTVQLPKLHLLPTFRHIINTAGERFSPPLGFRMKAYLPPIPGASLAMPDFRYFAHHVITSF
jgi:hypothetical protein